MRRAAALALLMLAGCGGGDDSGTSAMTLESPAFRDGGELPARFTCEGEGVSPPLRWSGVPDDAEDLALIVEDEDVPVGAFTHWTVWGLSSTDGLDEAEAPPHQGQNDAGERGWAPACPPKGDGPHHYVFKLYALDEPVQLSDGAFAAQVRAAVTASKIADARIAATFDR